ncbi:MAG: hypothetical protein RI897_3946 [Verrucomicrobiota bacterium]
MSSIRLRALLEVTIPSLRMRKVSERVVMVGASWRRVSVEIVGTSRSEVILAKKPAEER